MTSPFFSIIIPVYNREKYIRECLDSVLSQTFENWEAIVVDDGSVDQSREILESYANDDKRFKLIFQTNSGVSVARNRGLEKARGEYILFLDSDDWLHVCALERLFSTISQYSKLDMVLFNYNWVGPLSEGRSPLLDECYSIVGNVPFQVHRLGSKLLHIFGGVAGKLIRRDVIRENHVSFEPSLKNSEDFVFYVQLLSVVSQLSIQNEVLYYYRLPTYRGTLSASTTSLQDLADSCEYSMKNFSDKFPPEQILARFLRSMMYTYNLPSFKKDNQSLKLIQYYVKKAEGYGIENVPNLQAALKFINVQNSLKNRVKRLFNFQHIPGLVQLRLCGFNIKIKGPRTYRLTKKIQNSQKDVLSHIRQKCVNQQKIKVTFLFNEYSKIKTLDLIKLFKESPYFELNVIVVPLVGVPFIKQKEELLKMSQFFNSMGIVVHQVFNEDTGSVMLPSREIVGDILFYQQPWCLPTGYKAEDLVDRSLLCYIPYYVPNFGNQKLECALFHKHLFRYYTLNEEYSEIYEEQLVPFEKSLVAVGHPTVNDLLERLNASVGTSEKVIYAPHFSIGKNSVGYGTFVWSGFYILEFAKSHPQFSWVFKPHPRFARELVDRRIMTQEQVEEYFEEWRAVGSVIEGSSYWDLFSNSACLITDCGSFLTEYALTGKPVIHLVSGLARQPVYPLKKILANYYQAYSFKDLTEHLSSLLENKIDPKKKMREAFACHLKSLYQKSAAQNVYEDLLRVLNVGSKNKL